MAASCQRPTRAVALPSRQAGTPPKPQTELQFAGLQRDVSHETRGCPWEAAPDGKHDSPTTVPFHK